MGPRGLPSAAATRPAATTAEEVPEQVPEPAALVEVERRVLEAGAEPTRAESARAEPGNANASEAHESPAKE